MPRRPACPVKANPSCRSVGLLRAVGGTPGYEASERLNGMLQRRANSLGSPSPPEETAPEDNLGVRATWTKSPYLPARWVRPRLFLRSRSASATFSAVSEVYLPEAGLEAHRSVLDGPQVFWKLRSDRRRLSGQSVCL